MNKTLTLTFNSNSGGLMDILKVNGLAVDFETAQRLTEILYNMNEKLPDRRPCLPKLIFAVFLWMPCLPCLIVFNIYYFPLGFPFLVIFFLGYAFMAIPQMWFLKRSEGVCHDALVAIDHISRSNIRATYERDPKTRQMTKFTININET